MSILRSHALLLSLRGGGPTFWPRAAVRRLMTRAASTPPRTKNGSVHAAAKVANRISPSPSQGLGDVAGCAAQAPSEILDQTQRYGEPKGAGARTAQIAPAPKQAAMIVRTGSMQALPQP